MGRQKWQSAPRFKAVQESKQVVYLVPTTVLAQQHYNTFCTADEGFSGEGRPAVQIPYSGTAKKDNR